MDNSERDKTPLLKIIKYIAIIAIILIPTIYTTFFLGSMWDPYGNVDKLPVAVVNLDKACDYNGDQLAVGDELVKNLKEDASLDFSFVDAKTAQAGLDDGTYYMVITIPDNFSYNATTLLEDNPQKMELNYKTNPGKNYIASKMSESAIKTITSSIESSVTEVYAESVFNEFSTIGDQLTDAADGASQINDGLITLQDGSDTISSNLKRLYDSSLTFSDGINTYEEGINQYLSAVEKIQNGSESLNKGISTLNTKSSTLAEGVDTLNSGAKKLYTGLQSYTKGVTSLKEGAAKLNSNSSTLLAGANALNSGASQLQTGSESLLAGLDTLSSSIATVVNDENAKNIQILTSSLDMLNSAMSGTSTTTQSSSSNDLTSKITAVGTNLANVGSSVQDSSTYINEIKTKIADIKAADWFKDLDSTTQAEIIDDLSAPLTKLSNELNTIATETSSASKNLNSAVNGVTTVSSQSGSASQLLTKAKATITSLYSGLETVETTLNSKIIPGVQTINSGITTLKSGSDNLASGIETYTSGVSQVYEGTKTLNANSKTIINGAKSLSTGTESLNSAVPTLTEGIGQLAKGSTTLTQGLDTLSKNNASLKSGISTINSSSTSISEGVMKLYDGSLDLSDGVTKLTDGSKTLKDSLDEGAETASSTTLTDQSKEMFASPVESVEIFNSYVANNGSAMSAYMMCVGLWVGCLALCILFSTEKDLKNGKENPKVFWSKKIIKLACIAIIQAVVMVSLIRLCNGLKPAYVGRTYLVAISAALAFMAIVYFMNLLLGKIGSYVLLVFMVLQLSGSAGTYPIELSSGFYKAIHNYMPFTYAVNGFRNGISTGSSIVPQIAVLLGLCIVFTLLSVVAIIYKNKSKKESFAKLIEEAI